ncbi:FKBP-type peptidyl-prolyl cis-trans isomerase [Saccharophagus sp. K07]|jgi:FKBP-type peptidyl-prolyl cis-trans isomerase|uniref:FKBP-type peptidyl-prolyl cis-trans isomerase n=1 Tax=Saccharophagus sp. K07 TaxID=2283636 RepID=UPI001CA30B70|nr:FKBP-type peptidyl-prolyl cis-trans isomerase [Saccharophagus sp. K07]MBC6906239.1 FKBP-type peptidyl-prolyl cis-trans isomerase [Saccharophagus sp. K07]
MKKLHVTKAGLLGATIAAVLVTSGCNKESNNAASTEVKLDTVEQKMTYIVGYNMAKQAQANGLDFQKEVMSAAIQDVLDGKDPRIAQAEQQQIMMSFQEEQHSKREEERKVAAEKNLKRSQEFLTANAKKDGVKVTESGLQYEVLTAAPEGAASPTEDDVVKVHYHGTLVDGTVFDSSVERGQPVSFPVKGVINGWVEALQLMKVGDKFKLYIPPELGYGEGGTSGQIGPNDALIFEVELLEINPSMEGHP